MIKYIIHSVDARELREVTSSKAAFGALRLVLDQCDS